MSENPDLAHLATQAGQSRSVSPGYQGPAVIVTAIRGSNRAEKRPQNDLFCDRCFVIGPSRLFTLSPILVLRGSGSRAFGRAAQIRRKRLADNAVGPLVGC